ncbi:MULTISPECIES: hypothetical protein [Staphylococcus]|uniref:hypothetical protein n=1 Tax=Staphylococcus TaxID=1279 RepID=UPI0005E93931|nr:MULTISPECIES: hypothetical protein [Staphylococcus]COT24777.1 phage protein [Streptococcus pneumoniae]KTW08589.1 hypothetical protein NS346_04505 [Staphylococcus warneri]OIS42325.1 hypothetical protein A4A24_12245 [Staphylococcus warneri]OIS47711.1 hypothetical protein A4A23_12345 [Staphylococcus warneri]PTI86170.1 hypothetical protein BU077_01895 [Staphylococcus warneri]
MRYNKRVQFAVETKGAYNPKTNKTEKVERVYDPIPCNISPLSVEKTVVEFGDIKKAINIIRLNGHFEAKVTHAYINGVKYLIVKKINYEHDTVFYVEEVK